FRIARDLIYREHRRRHLPVESLSEIEPVPVSESAELDEAVQRGKLQRCLNLIATEQREVLVLRFFEELSYEDIARVTDTSVGTVRSRIHYGKAALKKALKENQYG